MYKQYIYIVLLLFSLPVLAQDKLEADRPGTGRTPDLVKGNHFQAEFGFKREKLNDDIHLTQHPVATLRYGLFNALEFRLEMISQSVRDKRNDRKSDGLRPLEVGLKAKILPEYKGFPSVAILGHLGLPTTSSKDYYNRRLPVEIRTLFGNTLSRNLKLVYNAGLKWEGNEREAEWMYSFSPVLKVTENVNLFIEQYAFLQQNNSAEHYFNGGADFYLSRNFMLDVSAGVGLSKYSSPYFFAAGLSFRIPVR